MTAFGATKIGIIGGAGWLGGAIADAMLASGLVAPQDLTLSYRSSRPERLADTFWTSNNNVLADRSDVVIVSVRPEDWARAHIDLAGKLVISVMAGIRLDTLSLHHNTRRVVRSLPNAAAEVRKSYTPWIATREISETDRAMVCAIFNACGVQDEVQTEADIDYLTGLTGSGPAFPALLAQAMQADAIAHGLDQDVARRAVNALLVGTGRLLELRDECPTETVKTFLGYRGTTAAAIEAMIERGFSSAVADGLAAAAKKSVRMGETC